MRIAGVQGLIELPRSYRFTKSGGKIEYRRWKGPPGLVNTKAAELESAGVEHDLQRNPGEYIVTATYGASETQDANKPITDSWRMITSDLEQDIWEHPFIVAEVRKTLSTPATAYAGALAFKDLKAILAGEKVKTEGGATINLEAAFTYCVAAGMNSANLWAFVQDVLKGTKSFFIDAYVLRRERIVHEATAIEAAAAANINRVMTRATLISSEKPPAKIPGFGPIPNGGEWLKRKPVSDPIDGGRYRLVQDYWHADAWSRVLYGALL